MTREQYLAKLNNAIQLNKKNLSTRIYNDADRSDIEFTLAVLHGELERVNNDAFGRMKAQTTPVSEPENLLKGLYDFQIQFIYELLSDHYYRMSVKFNDPSYQGYIATLDQFKQEKIRRGIV